jgi:hypothetical protein
MTDIFPKEMYLDYTGVIDFTRKKELITRLTNSLKGMEINSGMRKRMVYVLEELLSNSHEYYKKRELPDEEITLILELNENNELEIQLSNTVLKEDSASLLEKIELINSLVDEQLQDLFEKAIVSDLTNNFGGGLGLISIRMKTGAEFRVDLIEKNEFQNILNLKTILNLNI